MSIMTVERTDPPIGTDTAATHCETVQTELAKTVISTDEFLQTVLTGIIAGEHVLLEDVPGTGKTLTARSIARTLGLEFNRIQFTPDLLPSDITGSNVYDEQTGTFRFSEGPVFANLILADEINRAPPKTQAALLEAMEERQVSVGDNTRDLPDPFFVIATQNPVEQEGTFELPAAQRDRFMIKTSLGYPLRDREQELLDRRIGRITTAPTAEQVIDPATLSELQLMPEFAHVEDAIRDYIIDICRETRAHEAVDVGVSPRGVQRYLEAARARAVIHGRDFVAPDDVKSLAQPVLAHRLVLTSTAAVEGTTRSEVTDDSLSRIDVPAMNGT